MTSADDVRYKLEDRPPWILCFFLALQHVLSAFGAIILVPLIILYEANKGQYAGEIPYITGCTLVAAGVATLIQTIRFYHVGSGLPILMGTDFTFLHPGISAVSLGGPAAYFSVTILGSFVEIVLAYFIKPLRRFFPPVVTGSVVTLIGLSLIPIAVRWAGGDQAVDFGHPRYLLISIGVLSVIVFCNQFFRNWISSASVFMGLLFGFLLCLTMGMVEFNIPIDTAIISFPQPFKYGILQQCDVWISVLPPFLIAYIVTTIETVGDTFAVSEAAGHELQPDELRGAILADGVGSLIAGFFNAGPNTSFSQNVGIVALTRVASRRVMTMAACILVILGFIPILGVWVNSIPVVVLGGVGLAGFGMVAANGIKIVAKDKFSSRNLMILAITLATGLGANTGNDIGISRHFPEMLKIVLASGISVGCMVAVMLHIILPQDD